jgi:hypothetical protein
MTDQGPLGRPPGCVSTRRRARGAGPQLMRGAKWLFVALMVIASMVDVALPRAWFSTASPRSVVAGSVGEREQR